jgi:cobalt-zinc-cadmium efflux system outer membrane protein
MTSLLSPRALAQYEEDAVRDTINLEELLRLVHSTSPRARVLRAEGVLAEAEVALAGVYPNPTLSYIFMGRFDGGPEAINGSQHQAWLDVPLLIAGQHDARRDEAAATAHAVRGEIEVALLALEVDARRAFARLLAAQDRLTLLEAVLAELTRLENVVEARTRAGAQSPYDVTRIAVELGRMRAMVANANVETRAAGANLATVLGLSGWYPRAEGRLETIGLTMARDQNVHPTIEAARRRVLAAERGLHRAEIERWPEISLGGGGYFTTDGDSMSGYLGLSIPLPIFDTGEAAVRRARAARDAAIEARDAVTHETNTRLMGALAVLRARQAALEAFTADTAERLLELRAMAESSYRLGISSIFELLDGFRTGLEVESTRIDMSLDAIEAELDVLVIIGGR